GEAAPGRLAAAELSRLFAMLPPLADEFSLPRELLDAAVPLIGHIQQAVRPERNRTGKLELSVPRALPAPFAQELSRRRIGRQLVAVPMGDVDISLRINCNTPRMRLNGKGAEEPPLGRKLLDALIAELAGVHLIILTDGDAHAGAEFALPLAAASPLQQEPGRSQILLIRHAPCCRQQGETASP